MRKSKFSESQIVKILKEVEGGRTAKDVCREYGIHPTTYSRWTVFPNDFDPEVAGLTRVTSLTGDFDASDSLDANDVEYMATVTVTVSAVDDAVGEVVSALERNGLIDDTVIFFSSDNGPHMEGGADPDFFNSNGGLRGYKRDLYEGGIRVPLIAWWPGKIKPGTVTDQLSISIDLMPTMLDLHGVPVPSEVEGRSLLSLLDRQ